MTLNKQTKGTPLVVKVLLTIVAMEFFGPLFRDFSPSHALNPDWVGHARLHLVWLLGFMGLSGLVNLYLIWAPSPLAMRNLWFAVIWEACNLGGFWVSIILLHSYGGVITMPDTHVKILGFDENVFGFTLLTAIWFAAVILLRNAHRAESDLRAEY